LWNYKTQEFNFVAKICILSKGEEKEIVETFSLRYDVSPPWNTEKVSVTKLSVCRRY